MPEIKPVALPQVQTGIPATLSYELLARRPDLQAMRWYVQASLDQVDSARALFYPSFDIKAFFGPDSIHRIPYSKPVASSTLSRSEIAAV